VEGEEGVEAAADSSAAAPQSPPLVKVKRSFQAKLAEREAQANEPRRKTAEVEKEQERGRFGWGEWLLLFNGATISDETKAPPPPRPDPA